MNLSKVTRVEIIDENGRGYTNTSAKNVKLVLQDDNRTLKIFIEKGKETVFSPFDLLSVDKLVKELKDLHK